MAAAYWVNITLHLLAALFWLGGMFFLAIVGAPVLRAIDPPALRQRLFQALGERFRVAGWIAIAVLIATGMMNLQFRGWLQWEGVLAEPAFWRTATGQALAWKLTAVAAMIGFSAMHDFVLGPAAGRAAAGSPDALALRRRAALMARGNAVLGLVVVIAAVRLARG